MPRRALALVVLVGVAVGLGLPLLRPARAATVAGPRAVRLVGPGGHSLPGRYQAWANASLVPTVAGPVVLRLGACPGVPRAAGCVYTRAPRIVYLRPGLRQARGVLLHELGHVYDLTVLSNRDRGAFRRLMRRPHAAWWKGATPLSEWFAEAYAWCARYARIRSLRRYALYRYDPTPAQHRAACRLIRVAARDRTPPAPPAAPPVVTGDPRPPAPPPPATNRIVAPASTQRLATPTPAPTRTPGPSRTPRATPTPTATPSPTPTAIPTPTPTPEPVPTASPDPDPEPTPSPEPEPTPRT